MATLALNPEQPQAQQPTPWATQEKTDPTPTNPSTGKPEQKLGKYQLMEQDKNNLLEVRRRYLARWTVQRRTIVRNALRRIEYLKGNQYYVFEPWGFTFYDPFSPATEGTQQGKDDADLYRYVTNIIQWLERVFVSTLSAALPATRFQPSNAQSDLGNRIAQNASRANAYIERLNDAKSLLKQCLSYFALSGSYFRHTRFLRDARLSGDHKEMVPIEDFAQQELAPDRYICSRCVEDTPADATAAQQQPQCQNCGAPLSDADFHPAVKVPVSQQTQTKECPEGQVRQTVYNALFVNADPTASGAPTIESPVLDLSMEVDVASLKAMYPEMWEDTGGSGGESSGGGEGEVERAARLRAVIQNSPATSASRTGGYYTIAEMPTYSRTWIQPEAFNILAKKEDAESLRSKFPDGCCIATVNGKFRDIRPAKLNEEWTWGGTRDDQGLYPMAVLDPAMDFQDRLNDTENTCAEFYDRMAVFPFFYNSKALSKGFSGKYFPVGSGIPVPVKPEAGRSLKDVLWQPTFNLDGSIHQYKQTLLFWAQLLTGTTPQMYGGTQENIDTAAGQKQALNVATAIMSQYWDAVRSECARAAKNGVRCLAQNATTEVFDVVEGDDGTFKNEPIDTDALNSEFEAYPEADQGYPIGFDQQRQILIDLLNTSAKNPVLLEMLDPMKNRRNAARYILPGDWEIPGEKERIKVLQDINRLMQSAPASVPAPVDPMNPGMPGAATQLPSILPDKDVDDLDVTIQVTKEYLTNNYWKLKEQNPEQFENVRLYLKLAAQFQKEQDMAAQMPPPEAIPQGAPTSNALPAAQPTQ